MLATAIVLATAAKVTATGATGATQATAMAMAMARHNKAS